MCWVFYLIKRLDNWFSSSRTQAEKHQIHVQHRVAGLHLACFHRSLSDGQEHLVLRRELVLQVPVVLQSVQHSEPMTAAHRKCVSSSSTTSCPTHRCFLSFPHRPFVLLTALLMTRLLFFKVSPFIMTVLNTDYICNCIYSISPLYLVAIRRPEMLPLCLLVIFCIFTQTVFQRTGISMGVFSSNHWSSADISISLSVCFNIVSSLRYYQQ